MKCPHCLYENGWNSDSSKDIKGEEGGFWEAIHSMTREDSAYRFKEQQASVCGCPKCNKVFINENI